MHLDRFPEVFRILADKIKDMEGWKHGFVVEHRKGRQDRMVGIRCC